ncbi:MAG: hypothetical protein UW35_C0040G0004, partial [Candidatus Collierbacteria bacterium GW2011_GWF2_44_15]
MKKERAVRIFNLSEDVWPFIESMGDERAKRLEIEENADLSDRDLYSMAEEFEFTFISPREISAEFIDYFKKLCMVRELEILVPKTHSGQLCEDALNDKRVMKR